MFRKYKRQFNHERVLEIESVCTTNPKSFWNHIKNIGPRKCNKIPMEVYNADQSITCDSEKVLEHWRKEFENLYNTSVVNEHDEQFDKEVKDYISHWESVMADPLYVSSVALNANISNQELCKVISKLKNNKAVGSDCIPNEILKCKSILQLLLELFQFCFDTSIVPSEWYKSVIHPIHKSAETDPRVPTHYIGIFVF